MGKKRKTGLIDYPEIAQLRLFQKKNELTVSLLKKVKEDWLEVNFKSGARSWKLFIDDEYQDFKEENQPLCIFLVLKSLEDYTEASDYLEWCKISYLQPEEPKWLDYYRNLDGIYKEIVHFLGTISPFISSFDYEMRAGAYKELCCLT